MSDDFAIAAAVLKCTQVSRKLHAAERTLSAAVKGRRARIVADFRDQPFGRSKPNLRGQEVEVVGGHVFGDDVVVELRGIQRCARMTDLQFLPSEDPSRDP